MKKFWFSSLIVLMTMSSSVMAVNSDDEEAIPQTREEVAAALTPVLMDKTRRSALIEKIATYTLEKKIAALRDIMTVLPTLPDEDQSQILDTLRPYIPTWPKETKAAYTGSVFRAMDLRRAASGNNRDALLEARLKAESAATTIAATASEGTSEATPPAACGAGATAEIHDSPSSTTASMPAACGAGAEPSDETSLQWVARCSDLIHWVICNSSALNKETFTTLNFINTLPFNPEKMAAFLDIFHLLMETDTIEENDKTSLIHILAYIDNTEIYKELKALHPHLKSRKIDYSVVLSSFKKIVDSHCDFKTIEEALETFRALRTSLEPEEPTASRRPPLPKSRRDEGDAP